MLSPEQQMVAGLAAPAFQTAVGIGQVVGGYQMKKEASAAEEAARARLETTRYADYNQAYYDELQRRAQVGLPQEQMLALQQGADRSAGAALAVSEDRRGGLMGIGRAQAGLADAYMNIGLADVAQRNANAQQMLAEMSDRGVNTYTEQQGLNAYDLNAANRQYQEGQALVMGGLQTTQSGLANIGGQLSGGQSMGGGGAAPQQQTQTTTQQPPQANPFVPFNYNNGFNSTQNMYGGSNPYKIGQ